MKHRILLTLAAIAAVASPLNTARAATVTKLATGTDLADGASRSGGAGPGFPTSVDIATWTGAGPSQGAGLTLGSAGSWGGISVSGAATDIDITGAGTLTLGTSGMDLSASTVNLSITNNLTLGGAQVWNVASGKSLSIAGTVAKGANTLIITNGGNVSMSGSATGTGGLYINGGTLTYSGTGGTTADFRIGNSGSGNFTINGGDFTVTGNSDILMAQGGTVSTFTQSGGTLNLGSSFFKGANAATMTSTISVSGGTWNETGTWMSNQRGTGTLNVSGTANMTVGLLALGGWVTDAKTSTVNLNGGTVSCSAVSEQISSGGNAGVNSGTTSTFNFNGGTLKPTASSTTFMVNVDTVNVQDGGAIIDTSGSDITIAKALSHFAGATTDSLTKKGAGALTLSGASTYTGATTISNGTLYVTGSLLAGGTVAVQSTAILGGSGSAGVVTVDVGGGIEGGKAGTGTLTVNNLTFSGAGTIKVTTAAFYVPVAVTNALNVGGSVAINLGNISPLAAGTYHILSSASLFTGAGSFTAPAIRGGTLQTNFDGTTYYLDLVVSGPTGDDVWTGGINNTWDSSTTTNWNFTGDMSPSVFYPLDSVVFDDSTLSNAVDISVADVSPSTVTFNNNSQPYVLRGTKAIKAGGAVSFNGAASVTISNALSSSGGSLAITGPGAVSLNNSNSFPAGSLTVGSSAGTVTLNGPTTTSGAATVSGGTVNINAPTISSGNTLINGGTLAVGTGGSFRNGTGTLTVSGPSGATLVVNGGSITNLTGNITVGANVNESGTITVSNGTVALTSSAFNLGSANGTTATYNQYGGTVNYGGSGALTLGSVAGATATFNQTGGTFNYTSGVNFVMDNNASLATVNLSGGVFNSTGALQLTQRGTGVVNMASSANVTAGYAALVGWTTANSRGTINLNGGSLTVRKVQKTVDGQSAQGTATFNFNGGVLRASTNGLFMAGLNSANVLDGGAFIDDGGFTITNSQPLLAGGTGIGGLTKSGTGTLMMSGTNNYGGPTRVTAGTLLLTGSLTGGGGIAVTNGTFATTANIPNAGPMSVANGTLTVGANSSVAGPSLALGAASANTETINTLLGASTAYVPLAATNNNGLTVSSGTSNITLNVTGTMSGVGNYHLIQYNGAIQGTGFGAFKLGTTPSIGSYPRSVTMSLVNNPGFVDLGIVGEAIYWTGLNSGDFSGANNWKLANNAQTSFLTGDVVIFDNTTSVQVVNLNSNVSPTSITVNNDGSHNYTFNSATGNAISGGQLIKDGAGSLTLNNSNSFAGGTTLLNGTLLVGNSSALGTGPLTLSGGALQAAGGAQTIVNPVSLAGSSTANGANVLTLAGSITGGGTLTVASPATVQLTGTNTAASGTVNISSGVVRIANPVSLPTGTMSVGAAGTLNVNPGANLTVSAATAFTGSGLITLAGPAPTGNNAIDVHVANPAASLIGFAGNIVISNNVRVMPDTSVVDPFVTAEALDGSQLFLGDTLGTTNGLGLIKIAGRGANPSAGTGPLGALRVEQVIATGVGSAYFGPILLTTNAAIGNAANNRASFIAGNISGAHELAIIPRYNFTANATIVHLSGANTYGSTRVEGGNFSPYFSSPARLIADSSTALSSGAMTLDGGVLDVNGFDFTFANLNSTANGGTVLDNNTNSLPSNITVGTDNTSTEFSGALMDGTGTLGLTKVGTGTLTLSGPNTYSGATVVSNGAITVLGQIDSSLGGVTVAPNGILAGIGFITGAVTVDGRLVPGTNAGPFAPLTIPALTLNAGSSTLMAIDRAGGTYAQVGGFGTVNFGGTLIVTNLGGTFTNGDTFTLFQASFYSGSFATVQLYPPTPGPGLAWDTTQLASAGIVSVVSGVNTTPPHLTNSVSGGNLQLSWPADHLGWRLELQTNPRSIGLSNNWVTVPGSTNVTSTNFPVNPANPTVFYRLVYP